MIDLASAGPTHPFWAHVYDGRYGHILFGHVAWFEAEPKRFSHATGLDLGCVHGGALCAAVIPDGAAEIERFVSVRAGTAYSDDFEPTVLNDGYFLKSGSA